MEKTSKKVQFNDSVTVYYYTYIHTYPFSKLISFKNKFLKFLQKIK